MNEKDIFDEFCSLEFAFKRIKQKIEFFTLKKRIENHPDFRKTTNKFRFINREVDKENERLIEKYKASLVPERLSEAELSEYTKEQLLENEINFLLLVDKIEKLSWNAKTYLYSII
jgi:hypothetical protein